MTEEDAKGLTSPGKCHLCGGTFDKSAMTRHLKACRKTHGLPPPESGARKTRKAKTFHLLVEGLYAPQYWMHLEVPTDATLADLDESLRDIWLECCGHMSGFQIGKQFYASHAVRELDAKSMNVRLEKVLEPRLKFTHEYDFGTTTYLKLKVMAEGEAEVRGKDVQVLARNDSPEYPCGSCGKPAKYVCQECAWEEKGLLCDQCAKEHECGEEMLMPLANSPRAGVCAYTGPL